MPRRPRIDYAGAVHHITSRASAGGLLFADDCERQLFIRLLDDVVARFEWRCGAYCLMGTHYHLLVQTVLPTLSRGMHWLNGRFAASAATHRRSVGHVFRDRYASTPVEYDSHLLAAVRYIALNPVDAGLVAHPLQWPWSSYPSTVGVAARTAFLDDEFVLAVAAPGAPLEVARSRVRFFVELGLGTREGATAES